MRKQGSNFLYSSVISFNIASSALPSPSQRSSESITPGFTNTATYLGSEKCQKTRTEARK